MVRITKFSLIMPRETDATVRKQKNQKGNNAVSAKII
jgi:hypothetical protein